jgi:hypothetical protein
MKVFGKKLATAGVVLVSASAIAIAPTIQAPPRPATPAVQLAAATTPSVATPLSEQSNVLGALFRLDLSRFIVPPSASQSSFPTPPAPPGPVPTPNDFASAIKNTYVVIEPWVHYGFQIAQYAVGWIPWVGWLAPQIDIFYHFGERIVRSVVFNSADWLWGPLPFGVGLGNIARDSWNALVQLGIDEWNFWLPPLPPLPPLPDTAAQTETLATTDQSVASTTRPHPLRDALVALRGLLAGPDAVVAKEVVAQEVDRQIQTDLSQTDVTSTNAVETKPVEPQADPPSISAATSGDATPPQTTPGKAKPFNKKPKPTADTSNPSAKPSHESAGASNSTAGTSDDGAAAPHEKRFKGPHEHRSAGSPSGTASAPAA